MKNALQNLTSSLPRAFFARSTPEVACDLIGKVMMVEGIGGVINETEAYPPGDEAAHSFAGKTQRNAALFAEPGTIYVYRSYGIHFCVNVACEAGGIGGGVLFRGIIPFTESIPLLQMRRGTKIKPEQFCNGPGKLTQALNITLHDNFSDSCGGSRIQLFDGGYQLFDIKATPRIGISKNTDKLWRFVASGGSFSLDENRKGRRRSMKKRTDINAGITVGGSALMLVKPA